MDEYRLRFFLNNATTWWVFSMAEVDVRMEAILEAAEQGEATIMATLFDMASLPIDTPGEDGDTALHMGCLYGQLAVVRECLRRGASATACDEDGSTPLHDASAGGHYDIASLLLDHGASVFTKDNDGDTPLHLASNGGHSSVADLLISRAGGQSSQLLVDLLGTKNEMGQKPIDLAEDPTLMTKLRIAAGDEDAEGPVAKRRA